MSSDERKKIDAVFILEILGRPPEYLTETLKDIIKRIGEEKGVAVKRKEVKEPVEMHNQKDFYTSFAEVEVETDEILYLAILLFKYMPAHVEILSPQNLSLSNSGWNDIFNEITRRIHGYEEIVRISQTEKMILENQLKTILGENKKEEIKEKLKEIDNEVKEEKESKKEVREKLKEIDNKLKGDVKDIQEIKEELRENKKELREKLKEREDKEKEGKETKVKKPRKPRAKKVKEEGKEEHKEEKEAKKDD
jgi:hypothetical protein